MKIASKILMVIGLIIHILGSVLYLIPYDMIPLIGIKIILGGCFIYFIAYLLNYVNYNKNEEITDGIASFQIILPIFTATTYGLGLTYIGYTIVFYYIYNIFFMAVVVFAIVQRNNSKYKTCVLKSYKAFMKIMLVASFILFVKHSILVQAYITVYDIPAYDESNIILDYVNNISTIGIIYLFTIIYLIIKIVKRKEYMV